MEHPESISKAPTVGSDEMSILRNALERLHGIMEGSDVLEACPFSHQVGGHSPVVMLRDSHLVAKPLDKKNREFLFYQVCCLTVVCI